MAKIVNREIEKTIKGLIGKNKVIIVFGTRRVGKTVLMQQIAEQYPKEVMLLNAEDFDVQEMLKNRSAAHYKRLIGDAKLLIIDEAQVMNDIGQILKLMIDSFPALTVIATGSSSFDLANRTGEPLTGRQHRLFLHPLSQTEISSIELFPETIQNLDERLVFGSYPELFQLGSLREKSDYLLELVQSYLLKDILAYEGIRQSDKILKLLRLIAFQCGSEVSYNELGNQLGISKNTVETYLDLLSKVFIIYRLGAYSTNQRKEVSKSSKWFFYDNGIRNAIINDFRLPPLRTDIGQLWENYILSERIKRNSYDEKNVQYYFWRNYYQQEVDLVEVDNNVVSAYEFKYNPGKKHKIPPAFRAAYPDVSYTVITKENYLDWIMET